MDTKHLWHDGTVFDLPTRGGTMLMAMYPDNFFLVEEKKQEEPEPETPKAPTKRKAWRGKKNKAVKGASDK